VRVTPAPVAETPPAPPPVTEPAGPGALEGVPPPDDGRYLVTQPALLPEISFQTDPRWAIGLEGRAGVGMVARSDARGAFAFAGALLRAHYSYLELGGFYDHADGAKQGGTFSHVGGFVGGWIPYRNWVDFDAALGFGVRRYVDTDARYGGGGYTVNCPALSLIFGVSDRARFDKFGVRVGGQLVLTQDFGQKDISWTFQGTDESGEVVNTNGTTHVGGFSGALVFTLGFDYGESP
jgi:hypothetical protein